MATHTTFIIVVVPMAHVTGGIPVAYSGKLPSWCKASSCDKLNMDKDYAFG